MAIGFFICALAWIGIVLILGAVWCVVGGFDPSVAENDLE